MRVASPQAIDLIGRDAESRALTDRIDAARAGGGGALVVRGAPGIGKTSVLESTRAYAATAGMAVLRTTGVQSETHLPFAGLHHLLGPVFQDIDRLPASYRSALQGAFGMIDEAVSSPHLVAMATLHLLSESAEHAPLLLLVDDAQWLDGATASSLAFVARRLESDPIVLIAALRDGFAHPLLEAGLAELTVEALTDAHAQTLLDTRSPTLDPGLRDRVLHTAAGNPLALVELSTALCSTADADRLFHTYDMPLTTRLERAFADRLTGLAPSTRSFLRVAAADERGLLAELVAATSKLEGCEITLEVATEARAAGLVEVEGLELRFRHPLMRSAIHQAMSLEERQATHAALADTLVGDPDRRAWHRAAATIGTNEEVAAELDELWQRAYKRGAIGVAIEATDRAARFTEDPKRRAALLVRAALYAWVMGRASEVARLVRSIEDAHLTMEDRLYFNNLREEFGTRTWSRTSTVLEFVETAEQLTAEGLIERPLHMLYALASQSWWSNTDESTRVALVAAITRINAPEGDFRVTCALALASPVEHGAIVLDRLARRTSEPRADMRAEALKLGVAARAVGDFVRAEQFFDAHLSFCRSQGVLGWLSLTLGLQAWTKIQRGDWRSAGSMANESARLGEEVGTPMWVGLANLAAATIAAYRGEIDDAERLAADGERVVFEPGAAPRLALVQWPRGVAALAAGRYDEAYQHLSRIFEPSDIAYHAHVRNWVIVDLVEAAVYSGHEAEAAIAVRELEQIAATSRSPQLEGALRYARPVLNPEGNEAAFRADAELVTWPFTRARLQLAYGTWLRRQRRPADSRAPLRAARDAFDALGAGPWGERARQELRASGETSRRRTYDQVDALSPQELQIAQLAAEGMSNKEIARQLFVSHRTIGTHLYRIFPKLGVTARAHLRTALQGLPT